MPNMGRCAGEEFAAFAGMGILSSYLLLFISFYAATYKKEGRDLKGKGRRRSSTATARKAVIDMAHLEVPEVESAIGHGSVTANGNTKMNGSAIKGSATRNRRS